jgi:hypothetical protein
MFDPAPPVGAQKVEPQAILLRPIQVQQLELEAGPLGRVDLTFEHGVLYPLAEAHAGLCDFSEPFSARARRGRHIVRHQDKHVASTSLPDKGGVCVEITPEVTSKQPCLKMDQEAHGGFLPQERVRDAILLSLLVRGDHGLSGLVVHLDSARLGPAEAIRPHLLTVDEVQCQAVGKRGPELLYEVQRQSGSTWTVPVDESNLGIEPGGFTRRASVMTQHRVQERQQRVDRIEGSPPVAAAKAEGLALSRDQAD